MTAFASASAMMRVRYSTVASDASGACVGRELAGVRGGRGSGGAAELCEFVAGAGEGEWSAVVAIVTSGVTIGGACACGVPPLAPAVGPWTDSSPLCV